MNKYISQLNVLLASLEKCFHLPHANQFSGIKVTLQQYIALDVLARKGRCMMSELSKTLNIALSTMTELAGRLAKKDLVSKARDNRDRRIVWVNLTDKGSQIFQALKEKKQKHISSVLKRLTQNERQALMDILHTITRTGQ